MRNFVLAIGLVTAGMGLFGQDRAYGSLCGVSRHCCGCCCTPCCVTCCTVMKTCQETVYEYKEMTAYRVEYVDVNAEEKVPCVEYEPAPRPACVPDTVLVQPMPAACPPANPCAPCAANDLVPMNICRKVVLDGYRPADKEKPMPTTRVVAKQIAYQVTLCIPHVITKQVPVQVCCPVPCCCGCGGAPAKADCGK